MNLFLENKITEIHEILSTHCMTQHMCATNIIHRLQKLIQPSVKVNSDNQIYERASHSVPVRLDRQRPAPGRVGCNIL